MRLPVGASCPDGIRAHPRPYHTDSLGQAGWWITQVLGNAGQAFHAITVIVTLGNSWCWVFLFAVLGFVRYPHRSRLRFGSGGSAIGALWVDPQGGTLARSHWPWRGMRAALLLPSPDRRGHGRQGGVPTPGGKLLDACAPGGILLGGATRLARCSSHWARRCRHRQPVTPMACCAR
jgi:hypothetical protein